MRGQQIALNSLEMRGVDLYAVGTDTILNEARRLMDVKYYPYGRGCPELMFGPYDGWDEFKKLSLFLVSNFDDGYSKVAKYKEGDLLEAVGMPWKYGVVKRIVTTLGSTSDPKFCLEVSVGVGKTETMSWKLIGEKVKLAGFPPEIIELAKSQVESMCPLLKKEIS